MALTPVAFNPSDGLRNTTTYVVTPADQAAAREQIQGRLDELKDAANLMQTELASTANAKGASCVGVEDSAGHFTAAKVEGILAEIAVLISTHEAKKATAAILGHILAGSGVSIDANGVLTSPVMKIGSFTRDTSLATGTQAITGVGFTPRLVLFLSGVSLTSEMSIGFQNTGAALCVTSQHPITAGTWRFSNTLPINLIQGSGVEYWGYVSSWDADGFTVSWTKNGAKTGTGSVYYIAIK